MSARSAAAPLIGALGLLERAVAYTRRSLQLVTDGSLTNPTPCAGWDLYTLLLHMDDSLMALEEAADLGYVDLCPVEDGDSSADIVGTLRLRACSLLGAWTNNDGAALVSVAGCPISAYLLVSTGALEIAVHGWDVARACGEDRAVPPLLAEELLQLVPLLINDTDRPARFAEPVEVAPLSSPGDRLLAALGRRPVPAAECS